jgi:hypothetical protein
MRGVQLRAGGGGGRAGSVSIPSVAVQLRGTGLGSGLVVRNYEIDCSFGLFGQGWQDPADKK